VVVKYDSDQQAQDIIGMLNGVAIDRQHTFGAELLASSTAWADAVAGGHTNPAVLEELKEVEVEVEDEDEGE
jgi:hypothetical protein